MTILALSTTTINDCCQMVQINSSHTDAVDIIGSYIIDAASRTFYKQNKPTGHYLFLNEATGWWTVKKYSL